MRSEKSENVRKINCGSQLFRMLLAVTIAFSFFAVFLSSNEISKNKVAAAAIAVMDPNLSAAVLATPGPFEVIVTFRGDSAPGAAEITALNQACLLYTSPSPRDS